MKLASTPTFAHAHLKQSVQADKATVERSPDTLTLIFSEDLNLAFSGVDIADASGISVEHEKPRLEGDGGTYTVNWYVLSTDGHKTNGTYSFTVKP
jgi:methionine-rich copper-binding protein CopC